ncbi:MAG TPA: two-component regulator propeller domain-containing protein [Cyclobacteriaceae bacterium]
MNTCLGYIASCLLSVLEFCVAPCALSQPAVPIGQWRTHVSYNSVTGIAVSDQKVYAACGTGMMVLDLSDRSLSVVTALNGLSGDVISTLAFDRASGELFIGYASGALDVISETDITHFNWVNETIEDASIRQITFANGLGYLATPYGLVVFDVARHEVRETWRDLGVNGTSLDLFQSAVLGDSVYIATEAGVLAGRLADNLLDYHNWKRHNQGELAGSTSAVSAFNGRIYAAVDGAGIFYQDNGTWIQQAYPGDTEIVSLTSSDDHLVICEDNHAWLLSRDNLITEASTPSGTSFRFALEAGGIVWIGDNANGLLSAGTGAPATYVANGPAFQVTRKLARIAGRIYALGGGYTADYQALGNPGWISSYADGAWTTETASVSDITDAVDAKGATYVASFGGGVQAGPLAAPTIIYDESNSTLINSNPPGDHVNITALASDSENVWAANFGASEPLHRFDGNSWESYAFATPASRFPLSLELDYTGAVWAALSPSAGGGILVVNSDGNSVYLTDAAGSGGLPHDNVNCLAADRDARMWVGTDNGVAYFPDPAGVFNPGTNAVRPIFEGRFLLTGQKVTAIAIDGGNRKWIGTEQGIWLFGPEGEELVYHFNRENSPLPSDNILDIGIDDATGEVFVATAAGLVSYRSDATAGHPEFGAVKIFPNPVTFEFSGLVGISGLATDAVVKITDAGGRLVWQTYAAGGTATWNVRNYNGQRVKSGIYLVFSTSTDGSEHFVGRIAVVE